MGWARLTAVALLLTGCAVTGPGPGSVQTGSLSSAPEPGAPPVSLLLAGDVMLGRGVATLTALDPASALAGVLYPVADADVAAANLESPLTTRPHDDARSPYALEASPGAAGVLAAAGLDVLGVANNHAGDAGPATVPDTLAALAAEGLTAVGGGRTCAAAYAPADVEVRGLRVVFLAFDVTRLGPRCTAARAGVARWDDALGRQAVARARSAADVVVVGLHGGVEYERATDPELLRLATALAGWGVDVVWGHGPHVVQPVLTLDPDGDGRVTVVATSLGNLLFDQRPEATRRGALLEVLVQRRGVLGWRVGDTSITAGRATFRAWRSPTGDVVGRADGWWSLVAAPSLAQPVRPHAAVLAQLHGDAVDAAVGDVTGDGHPVVVVAFRRPHTATAFSGAAPGAELVDRAGRSAHVGVYRTDGLQPLWVAGALSRPVAQVAACGGWLAVTYSTLDDAAPVALGAWRWIGFGFRPLTDLPGAGRTGCADVDGDGALDPVALGRSST